ncbi:MAG: TonB-dependent receptor [Rhizorhabdus sp.]
MVKSKLKMAGVLTGALLMATQASAQATLPPEQPTAEQPADGQPIVADAADAPGDIVVTALRRNSTVQSTPLSIVALSGDTLAKRGATQLQDYFRQVPNLNLNQGQIGQSRISIRGVNAAGEATVGLYYDETPVAGPAGTTQDSGSVAADLNLFDVERVEVLRGPQGTLYGASSMAGTLRVIFNKPSYTQVEGAGEVQLSSTDGGSMGYFGKGMINAPIIDDKLAVRLVGYYEKRPGYVDNVTYGTKNINDSQNWGVRGLIGLQPDEDTTITGTIIYQKSTADDQQGWYPQVGKYKASSSVRLPFDSKFQLYNLKLDRKLGGVNLTATGGYYRYDILRSLDFTPSVAALSRVPGACQAFYAQGTPCTSTQLASYAAFGQSRLPAIGYQPAWLRSQNYEVRLSSDRGNLLEWTVGGYYERRHDHIDSNVTTVSALDGSIPDPLQNLSYRYVETRQHQVAGFGELSLHPVENLTLTAGARYYDYRKTVAGEATLASPLTASALAPFNEETAKEHGWLEKFNVSYRITPRVMVYASASKGFRPGGANNIPVLPANLIVYKADSLWNYEAGLKSSWLDNKLVFNAAIFQIDWSDMQVSARTADGLYSFLTNAGKARVRGGEADLTLYPVPGLTLNGAVGYSDARLTQDQSNSAVLVTATTGRDGDRIPNTPAWTASASASYNWPLTDNLDGMLRADYAYTGDMRGTFRTTDPYFTRYGKYSTVNLRAGVEKEGWGLYVFCQNLTNEAGITGRSTGLGFTNLSYSIPPRTIGINARFGF